MGRFEQKIQRERKLTIRDKPNHFVALRQAINEERLVPIEGVLVTNGHLLGVAEHVLYEFVQRALSGNSCEIRSNEDLRLCVCSYLCCLAASLSVRRQCPPTRSGDICGGEPFSISLNFELYIPAFEPM